MNYTEKIFNHYFSLLLKMCNISDGGDCVAEIEAATHELVSKIKELEKRIEQLEKK